MGYVYYAKYIEYFEMGKISPILDEIKKKLLTP